MDECRRLTRLRWGVRGVLALGVAASVAANVLHAQPNPISQAIAAWPPIALLLTVELISRVPVHRRVLAVARIIATMTIATIAAWVSYHHMAAVAARYGETGASPYLLPLSVDGLVVVASVCLVELAGRITQHTSAGPARNTHVATAILSAPPQPGDDEHDEATPPSPTPPSPSPAPGADRATDAAPAYPSAPPRTARTEPADAGGGPLRQRPIEPVKVHPDPADDAAPLYEPASDEDAAMYGVWRRGIAAGREPSGADLARAAGRPNDASGIGRKAARRYRDAHADARAEDPPVTFTNAHTNYRQTTAAPRNGAAPPWPHNGHRPNGAAA